MEWRDKGLRAGGRFASSLFPSLTNIVGECQSGDGMLRLSVGNVSEDCHPPAKRLPRSYSEILDSNTANISPKGLSYASQKKRTGCLLFVIGTRPRRHFTRLRAVDSAQPRHRSSATIRRRSLHDEVRLLENPGLLGFHCARALLGDVILPQRCARAKYQRSIHVRPGT